jgi:hypothetical protein
MPLPVDSGNRKIDIPLLLLRLQPDLDKLREHVGLDAFLGEERAHEISMMEPSCDEKDGGTVVKIKLGYLHRIKLAQDYQRI